tara:strand:- start:24 stop:524 length:501 start_codon:yes stop_codon:yes gene_type:complete
MFKKLVQLGVQKIFKPQKTTGTEVISAVNPNVPKNKAEVLKRDLKLATQKRKASEAKLDNTIFRINQQKKRLEEMKTGPGSANPKRPGKMGGGFMGKRMGYKRGTGLTRKSNIQKIKETFGPKQKPQSRMTGKKKFPDLTGDGKVTFADILKGRGVINGKKKKKVI